jgi:DNA-binding transcriptional ArsR family regulator
MSTALAETVGHASVVDLPSLNPNFPPTPPNEVSRDNLVNTLRNLVNEGVYAVAVEGADGMGKTTLLSQFVRKHATTSISLVVTAANRFSIDPDLMRTDLAIQVYWALTGDVLDRRTYDPTLLKSYYADLQRLARRKKQTYYFVVDGADELDVSDRRAFLQTLSDVLPLGIPQYRFLFGGDERLFRPLLPATLALKSYPLNEFSVEETRTLFANHALTTEVANELNSICRGMPGRLTVVLRAVDKGATLSDLLNEAPTELPELFDFDWRQVPQTDETLIRILALLVHDPRPHTVTDLSELLNLTDFQIREHLSTINFVYTDEDTRSVRFANSGIRKYVAERLKDKKIGVQRLLVKHLLANPAAEESLLVPQYLEECADYPALLDLLTPEHILQILERSQTLSRVDDTVRRGFRGAQKLERDADILRFGIQQSVIGELALGGAWESEVAALVALGKDNEALALANSAILREDRVQMLATLAHGVWLRSGTLTAELLDQIRLLVENLDFWSLGRRAGDIASKLTCVSPDIATSILKKAKWADDDQRLDQAFVKLTVFSLRDLKDVERREQALETVARTRQDPTARGLIEGVRVLSGRLTPAQVIAKVAEVQQPEARLSILRYWCVFNASTRDADLVAKHALDLAVATPQVPLDASLLNDLSAALAGAPDSTRTKTLIDVLDGLRKTADRLGPSIEFVRLQAGIALAEAGFDVVASEGRLIELLDYAARIGDLPSRGEAFARILATLRSLSRNIKYSSGDAIERQVGSELESVVLRLSAATADHYLALGGIICELSLGDLAKALDYVRILNTEHRRDAVLVDVVGVLLHRPAAQIVISEIKTVLSSISLTERRDEALRSVFERFWDDAEKVTDEQMSGLLPLIGDLPTMEESVPTCRALVCALRVLHGRGRVTLSLHLMDVLRRRWRCVDVGWAKVDTGYRIARDLARFSSTDAISILSEAEAMKAEISLTSHQAASIYIGCVQLVIRAFSGLLPRNLESDSDVAALAALIEVLPSYGERSTLWAEVCLRAALVGRAELAERMAESYMRPAFSHICTDDKAYRANILVRIAPAFYRTQAALCFEELAKLHGDDRDLALRQIIRCVLLMKVPSDPIDRSAIGAVETSFDTLLRAEGLIAQLSTDWMMYSAVKDLADIVQSPINRFRITQPQREDLTRRLVAIAREKLPIIRQITHPGFRIITVAQALRISHTRQTEWADLIKEAQALENVADRVYVLQILALALPKSMSAQRTSLLSAAYEQTVGIPSELDQIDRYLGLAEDVQGIDGRLSKECVTQAATAITRSTDDVRDQRRRLVDIAHRIDDGFAETIIEKFDDDEARQAAHAQVKLLEIRDAITDSAKIGKEQASALKKVRSSEVARLGAYLIKALNGGRVQTYHPSEIRAYLELTAGQPLSRAYAVLMWYIENSVVRFSGTDQAGTFLRPIFNSCIVGAQLAGRVAGRSLIRLRALRYLSNELSGSRSLLVTPGSQEEAKRVLSRWFGEKLGQITYIHDPYFGPEELRWIQLIRTARPNCRVHVMTARLSQPTPAVGEELADVYSSTWRKLYDQAPPAVEIIVIGGETSKASPIHDRWLVSESAGLRFGTSLNTLGQTKDSEISEMAIEDAAQRQAEILQFLEREKTEHNGEVLRMTRFWV